MSKKILVAYATWAGSTAEVGEAVAKVLRSPSVEVDVLTAREVRDLATYHAQILGTPIRMSTPHQNIQNFVRKFKKELSILPVAVFVVCLNMSEDNQQNRLQTEGYLQPLYRSASGLKVREHRIICRGYRRHQGQGILEIGVIHTLQGDFRHWGKINTWAEEIKPLLCCGWDKPL